MQLITSQEKLYFNYNFISIRETLFQLQVNVYEQCVWMKQFKRVIHLFREFEFLLSKITCLDEGIKRRLKLKNFKNVFQITKIIEFEIPQKGSKLKFHNLWNPSLFKIRGANLAQTT